MKIIHDDLVEIVDGCGSRAHECRWVPRQEDRAPICVPEKTLRSLPWLRPVRAGNIAGGVDALRFGRDPTPDVESGDRSVRLTQKAPICS